MTDAGRGTGLARRAVRVLLDHGLLAAADVHRYGLTARDVSESNGVVLVELGNGRGFAVKDLAGPRDGGQGEPDREVALYRAAALHMATESAAGAAGAAGLGGILPRFELHDPGEGLLVLEGLLSAQRLDRVTAPLDPLGAPLAAEFGRVLGAWHRLGADLPALRPVRPWLLDVDGPGRLPVLDSSERLRTLTAAVLADPAHRAALSTVDAAWTPDTAIHGDVRFANVLIRPPGDALLVDWESSGHGDADWDVAGGVQEYVSAGGVFPTSPAVAAFLAGYARGSGRPVDTARLAAFVACRLLVRAWQLTNWLPDPASEVERHRALARAVLQTGGNR